MIKSAVFYNTSGNPSLSSLESDLADKAFQPCGKSSVLSIGWIEPAGHGTGFIREVMGMKLITLGIEKKDIPNKLVKRLLNDQIDLYEQKHGQKPNGPMKKELKEEIIFSLIPSAFPKFEMIHVLISEKYNGIMVGATSHAKAETVLAALSNIVSFKPKPVSANHALEEKGTQWVSDHQAPDNFILSGDLTLKDGEGASTTLKGHQMPSQEVDNHLEAGEHVVKLGLYLKEEASFTLTEKLIVTGIKYDGSIAESVSEDTSGDDSPVAAMEATMALTNPILVKIFTFVKTHFE